METQINRQADRIKSEVKGIVDENVIESLEGVFQQAMDFSYTSLRTVADYTRRHPFRVGLTLVAIGALGTYMAKSKSKIRPELH